MPADYGFGLKDDQDLLLIRTRASTGRPRSAPVGRSDPSFSANVSSFTADLRTNALQRHGLYRILISTEAI
jgi:hypothetical protein